MIKKIILTFLIGLFSCQNTVVENNKNNDKKLTTENKNSLDFTGKDCKPYDLGNPPVKDFSEVGINRKNILFQKMDKEKKEFYSGKIKVAINEDILSYKLFENRAVLKINNEFYPMFLIGNFKILFNNSCEYDFFKSKVEITAREGVSSGFYDGIVERFEGIVNVKNEKIDPETVQYLLKEYNKYFIEEIKEIEFSSIDALKTFIMFIRLTTQEPTFYRDFEITYHLEIPQPTEG
ncbi:MAG: hypothetical protein U0457_07230 [Candidatus Sericytochromatia bacterium]